MYVTQKEPYLQKKLNIVSFRVKSWVRQIFFIFVNDDLQYVTKYLDPIMFADDTNLFYSNNSISELFENVNKELANVTDWCFANKLSIKDTHREKAPSNKLQRLQKKSIMGIWVVGTSNQPFIRGSQTETKFSKNKVATAKTPLILYSPFYLP